MIIYAIWTASNNPSDLFNIGIQQLGKRVYCVPMASCVYVAFIVESQSARQRIATFSPNLVPLPGARGLLDAVHVTALSPHFPTVQIGMPHNTVLATVYATVANENFNPNNF